MEDMPKNANSHSRLRRLIAKFRDKEYRDSYVRSHTKQFLARQMRAFRGDQSQKEFAEGLGVSQSIVSERLENVDYGKANLTTLFDTAAKLNVAVFVRYVSFEKFLELSGDLSDNAVRPQEYNQESTDKLTADQHAPVQFDLGPPEQPTNWKVVLPPIIAETEDQPQAVEA